MTINLGGVPRFSICGRVGIRFTVRVMFTAFVFNCGEMPGDLTGKVCQSIHCQSPMAAMACFWSPLSTMAKFSHPPDSFAEHNPPFLRSFPMNYQIFSSSN